MAQSQLSTSESATVFSSENIQAVISAWKELSTSSSAKTTYWASCFRPPDSHQRTFKKLRDYNGKTNYL